MGLLEVVAQGAIQVKAVEAVMMVHLVVMLVLAAGLEAEVLLVTQIQ
jgi:hypothetical protein